MNILFYFPFLFLEVYSITLVRIGRKPDLCLYKNFDGTEDVFFSFTISGGYQMDKCHILFYDPKNELIYSAYNADKGNYIHNKKSFPNAGKYKICFKPLTYSKMYINLEFYVPSEIGVIPDIAKDRNI